MARPLSRPAVEPPLLWPAVSTPAEEATAIKDLYANLSGVSYHVEAWRAALALYEFAKSRPANVDPHLARQWTFIACHECIMVVYHLREAMLAIQSHKVRLCPSLNDHIEHDRIRKAMKTLAKEFPAIDDLRDATAHQGSISANPAKHAHDGFGLRGFRDPDRFSAPYKGVLRHLDITQGTLTKLEAIASDFMQAFLPAARMLEQLGHAED